MNFIDELNDPNLATRHILQGTEEWDRIRVGRFTSSEFFKLMCHGYRELTPEELKERPKKGKGSRVTQAVDLSQLGTGAEGYIREKVAEVLTGRPKDQAYAYPLVWGKEHEQEAVDYFQEKTGLICEPVGFCPYTDHAGGSPDRFIGDNEGLEVKCPQVSTNQIDYLMLTDHYDLKNLYPEYYWQCVTLMLFTARSRWHFITYDGRFISDKHKMTHIIIDEDKVREDMDLINIKLTLAVEEKLKLLKLLE